MAHSPALDLLDLVRWPLLAIAATVALATGSPSSVLAALAALGAVSAVASGWALVATRPAWWAAVEAIPTGLIAGAVGQGDPALMPCLLAPGAGAMAANRVGLSAIATAMAGASELLALRLATPAWDVTNAWLVVQWTAAGLLAAAAFAVARGAMRAPSQESDVYRAAHELLSKLADVARALPTGLDEVALASNLLDRVKAVAPYDCAGLYTATEGGRLLALTVVGAERLAWEQSHPSAGWDDVAAMHARWIEVVQPGDPDRTCVAALFPAALGGQRIGLVAIEREGPAWSDDELEAAQSAVDEAALQLDTGRLFSDVRAVATTEERRRLAREIHDGIAQEIASLGYAVDDIAARVSDAETAGMIRRLRDELSRIVGELRMSIFDLRSDVRSDTGLAAALSNHVRQVGASSGLTVHLVLDESSSRLSVGTETELLRIAQEAVTNARRHAHASNLWVTCRVHPPSAFLRIADDGRGLGSPRADSYGLEIMRERAARLGAQLVVRDREDGGTVVEVALGQPDE